MTRLRITIIQKTVSIEQDNERLLESRRQELAKALAKLGVGKEDRVGTFCWNSQEHLEAAILVRRRDDAGAEEIVSEWGG